MKFQLGDYVVGKGWLSHKVYVGIVTELPVIEGVSYEVVIDQFRGIVETQKISVEQYDALTNLLKKPQDDNNPLR